VGLTKTGQVYFWGNHKYSCDKASQDFDKPVIFKDLAGVRIKDISVSRYQCVALNEQGEIIKWGKYMAEKMESKMGGDVQVPKGSDIKSVSYFQKFDVLMSSLATGPNHAAGISVKKSLYSWGLSDGGRLGLQPFSEDA
jgi:alpha-tubulin suppressor-like RCC1 family protein